MSKINKIICDRCKKQIEEATGAVKIQLVKSDKDARNYRIYKSEGRLDLCAECYKDFEENYLKI